MNLSNKIQCHRLFLSYFEPDRCDTCKITQEFSDLIKCGDKYVCKTCYDNRQRSSN